MRIMLTYLIRSGWFSAVIMRLLESDREYYLSRRTFLSLTKDISFSHRTHRSNRTFLRTVSNSQKASGIQISQNVIANVGCNVL